MDQQESNKKKAKTWLHRFLKIKNRFQSRAPVSDLDSDLYGFDPLETKPHRSSFRRSLKKMHTRVKSCMFPQEVASRRPVTITEASRISPPTYEFDELDGPPPVPERSSVAPPPDTWDPMPPTPGPPVPGAREPSPIKVPNHRIPTDEVISLWNCYWYWGPMPTAEAEEKLQYKPDGTFLVRDSSSTNYLFSVSFRSVGKTMHARIEYSRGRYNLCGTYQEGFETVSELIQDAMKTSENGIYCYSRRGEHAYEFPVRLTKPILRFTEVRPLKHLCKFVIRRYINMNDIPKLPLPTVLHDYLLEKPYL